MRAEINPVEAIARVIYALRGQRVLLDRDLAALYGVETRALNQAVKRNAARLERFHVPALPSGNREDITICDILVVSEIFDNRFA